MKQHLQIFQHKLAQKYPESEISSLFLWATEHLTGWSRTQCLLMRDHVLPNDLGMQLNNIANRLAAGEPIQYIFGEAEFCSLPFFVDDSVLIPRPETEELVAWILQNDSQRPLRVLDMGTGSGCIAIAIKKARPQWQVAACDISEQALATAKRNAERNAVQVDLARMDMLQPQWTDKLDIIVSNPPYICQSEQSNMANNVLQHEPHLALFVPDNDPLLFYKAIATFAQQQLTENGQLFWEINRAFGQEAKELLQMQGFSNIALRTDLSGNDRMVHAIKQTKQI